MAIGGLNESLHTLPPVAISYNHQDSDMVGLQLGRISMGSTVLHRNASALMPSLILDSGSTTSVLASPIVGKIQQAIAEACLGLGEQCWLDPTRDHTCLELQDIAVIREFPDISITFGEREVPW
jgi:hypothetical protein